MITIQMDTPEFDHFSLESDLFGPADVAIRNCLTMYTNWSIDNWTAGIAFVEFDGKELRFLEEHFTNLPICRPRTTFVGDIARHIIVNLLRNLEGPSWGIPPKDESDE
jgi:hypothetical protein